MRRLLTWDRVAPVEYWGATWILRTLLTLVVRWKVTGRENIPTTDGLLIVANHLNAADPPILAAGIARRRIRFMAKIELFKYPFGVIIRGYGAFPVRRFDSDVRALLTAERLLRDGWAVGMFPEGTRSRTGYLGAAHPGTALIALRSGATVLPCAITGTEVLRTPWKLALRPRMTIAIGQPLRFEPVRKPSEEQIGEATDRIFEAIKALLPSRYHPPYTGSVAATEAVERSDAGDSPGD